MMYMISILPFVVNLSCLGIMTHCVNTRTTFLRNCFYETLLLRIYEKCYI